MPVMTWWAVSLMLLSHDFGNGVLSAINCCDLLPIFIAVLVWLTRVMFIGSMAVAGDQLFDFSRPPKRRPPNHNNANQKHHQHAQHCSSQARRHIPPKTGPTQQRPPAQTPVRRPAPLRTGVKQPVAPPQLLATYRAVFVRSKRVA